MADTVAIDDFVRRVSMDCPGGVDHLKREAIRTAAVDFFKQTRAWRIIAITGAFVGPYTPQFDVNNVVRELYGEATVFDVNDVWLSAGGTRLKELSRAVMNASGEDWRTHEAKTPTGYYLTPDRHIRVHPAIEPGAPLVGLDIEMVLIPTLEAEKLPAFAYNIYSDTICAGATQRLKTQPGMPWSSPEQARHFMRIWKDGVREARLEKARRVANAVNERRRRSFR